MSKIICPVETCADAAGVRVDGADGIDEVLRMDCEAHDVGAPFSRLCEILFVPMAVPFKLDRVGEAQAPEDDREALRIYELVAFDMDASGNFGFWCASHERRRAYRRMMNSLFISY